jgi:hypothetical protein
MHTAVRGRGVHTPVAISINLRKDGSQLVDAPHEAHVAGLCCVARAGFLPRTYNIDCARRPGGIYLPVVWAAICGETVSASSPAA